MLPVAFPHELVELFLGHGDRSGIRHRGARVRVRRYGRNHGQSVDVLTVLPRHTVMLQLKPALKRALVLVEHVVFNCDVIPLDDCVVSRYLECLKQVLV